MSGLTEGWQSSAYAMAQQKNCVGVFVAGPVLSVKPQDRGENETAYPTW